MEQLEERSVQHQRCAVRIQPLTTLLSTVLNREKRGCEWPLKNLCLAAVSKPCALTFGMRIKHICERRRQVEDKKCFETTKQRTKEGANECNEQIFALQHDRRFNYKNLVVAAVN